MKRVFLGMLLLASGASAQQAADGEALVFYHLSGSKALRPVTIRDDGAKTYIEWARDQTLPATFSLSPTGEEQMVDGYMRGGVFTIDRVYPALIFRIDKQSAKARRRLRAPRDD